MREYSIFLDYENYEELDSLDNDIERLKIEINYLYNDICNLPLSLKEIIFVLDGKYYDVGCEPNTIICNGYQKFNIKVPYGCKIYKKLGHYESSGLIEVIDFDGIIYSFSHHYIQ